MGDGQKKFSVQDLSFDATMSRGRAGGHSSPPNRQASPDSSSARWSRGSRRTGASSPDSLKEDSLEDLPAPPTISFNFRAMGNRKRSSFRPVGLYDVVKKVAPAAPKPMVGIFQPKAEPKADLQMPPSDGTVVFHGGKLHRVRDNSCSKNMSFGA